MNDNIDRIARCPEDGTPLDVTNGRYTCSQHHSFDIQDGFPALVYPPSLTGSDAEFRAKYDEGAHKYDAGMEWLFKSFYEDELKVRTQMVDLLALEPGMIVLEVGGGTGATAELIRERVGPSGRVILTELSPPMLARARDRLGSSGVDYLLCNGSYLPFAPATFDRVFHFGGINEFSEKARAISEMARVTKRGGIVVFGDESVPPWQRHRTFGRVLTSANKLYHHEPPLEMLPENAREVSMRWVLGEAFYLIRMSVDTPPPLDLDLPIPGKQDSLRSRHDAAYPDTPL